MGRNPTVKLETTPSGGSAAARPVSRRQDDQPNREHRRQKSHLPQLLELETTQTHQITGSLVDGSI